MNFVKFLKSVDQYKYEGILQETVHESLTEKSFRPRANKLKKQYPIYKYLHDNICNIENLLYNELIDVNMMNEMGLEPDKDDDIDEYFTTLENTYLRYQGAETCLRSIICLVESNTIEEE